MRYEGQFIWPPRPADAFPSEMIESYEYGRAGYVSQVKKNGTCTVYASDSAGNVTAWDRHGNVQRAWKPKAALIERIRDFMPDGAFALEGELMHNKVPGIRDTLYVFDILALRGDTLSGTTFRERYEILKALVPGGQLMPTHRDMGSGLWIARTFLTGHSKLYHDVIKQPENEGIVVKQPGAKLSNMLREGLDNGWQAKCRKPTKNYSY